jgi:hypothetical protein
VPTGPVWALTPPGLLTAWLRTFCKGGGGGRRPSPAGAPARQTATKHNPVSSWLEMKAKQVKRKQNKWNESNKCETKATNVKRKQQMRNEHIKCETKASNVKRMQNMWNEGKSC